MGVPLQAPLERLNGAPTYLVDEADVRGSYRTVASTAERDAIPSYARKAGMKARDTSTGIEYVLAADLTTWSQTGGAPWSKTTQAFLVPSSGNVVDVYLDSTAWVASGLYVYIGSVGTTLFISGTGNPNGSIRLMNDGSGNQSNVGSTVAVGSLVQMASAPYSPPPDPVPLTLTSATTNSSNTTADLATYATTTNHAYDVIATFLGRDTSTNEVYRADVTGTYSRDATATVTVEKAFAVANVGGRITTGPTPSLVVSGSTIIARIGTTGTRTIAWTCAMQVQVT